MSPLALEGPSGWQGPLRAGVAILIAGLLVVWLVKPIGDPCPDLSRLPQGSSASSSPSFAPPLTRTCTYTVTGGTQAHARYVPWLDWIVLLLVAGLAAAAVRLASPGGWARPARAERAPRPERAPRAERPARTERAKRPPRTARPAKDSGERDAAERERARRERAERAQRRDR
jgi:hypothetical protein